jgi:UDP-N-acetylmuramate dehydrogenase
VGSTERVVNPQADVPLSPLTTMGVGGLARWYIRADSTEQARAAHAWASERGMPLFVLGGGSNIVVADAGFPGLVLHVAMQGVQVSARSDDAVVDAAAGEPWDPLVARVVGEGYAGMECLSGIPGLVGGTPIQNVGAYGQEVADTIEEVTVLDRHSAEVEVLRRDACGFSYRQSRFKSADAGRFLVCRVRFRVQRAAPTVSYPDVVAWVARQRLDQPTVGDIRTAVLEIRRSKGMVLDNADPDTRSVGSFFMNPIVDAGTQLALGAPGFPMPGGLVKIPAAWLIERAGFARGYAAGAAGLSSKHLLAIVNRSSARAADIVELACRIKRAVYDRLGVTLRPEPVFVGFGDDERVQFLQTDKNNTDVDAAY